MTLADVIAAAYSQPAQQGGADDFVARLGNYLRPADRGADPRMFQGPQNWPFGLPMLNTPEQALPQMQYYAAQRTLPT